MFLWVDESEAMSFRLKAVCGLVFGYVVGFDLGLGLDMEVDWVLKS